MVIKAKAKASGMKEGVSRRILRTLGRHSSLTAGAPDGMTNHEASIWHHVMEIS
jgi:hypothetical protein